MFKPILATIVTVTGLLLSTTLPVNASTSTVKVEVKFKMNRCYPSYECADIVVRIKEDGYLALKSPKKVSYTHDIFLQGSRTSTITNFHFDWEKNIYSFSQVDKQHRWPFTSPDRVTLNKVCLAEQCVKTKITGTNPRDGYKTEILEFNID